jgi:putative chitinase
MRASEFITEKIKGKDGKACWKNYRYNGSKGGKDSCVKVAEARIKPTGNDSPQAWIDYFLTSDHPSLKGQDPDTLKRMALAARSRAVHNPPKPKPAFKPRPQNPNARYWWQEKDEDVEEGWKDWVAGAAIGAAALGGHGDAEAAKKKSLDKPAVVQQVKKQDIKKIDPLKAVSKKEIAKSVTGNPHEVVLKKAAEKAGIVGPELAAFLAQCAHETLDFKHMKEIGGSLDFKKYDIRFAPNKAKALGNTKPGDGAKYAGRGYIQLTGKYNYAAASKAIYGDDRLVKDPKLVEKPEVAAKTSVWFWQNRVSNKVKNFDNVKDVTKGINPGLKHLDQRKDKFQDFKIAMR